MDSFRHPERRLKETLELTMLDAVVELSVEEFFLTVDELSEDEPDASPRGQAEQVLHPGRDDVPGLEGPGRVLIQSGKFLVIARSAMRLDPELIDSRTPSWWWDQTLELARRFEQALETPARFLLALVRRQTRREDRVRTARVLWELFVGDIEVALTPTADM